MIQENVRERLIESIIRVGTEYGIENVTVRKLANDSKINANYIYRQFDNLDELMTEAFLVINRDIEAVVYRARRFVDDPKYGSRLERDRQFFHECWDYLHSHAGECQFYCRFKFCALFTKEVYEKRNEIWKPVHEFMWRFFPEHRDPWIPIEHIIESSIRYSAYIAQGTLGEGDITEEQIFQVVWAVVDMDTAEP